MFAITLNPRAPSTLLDVALLARSIAAHVNIGALWHSGIPVLVEVIEHPKLAIRIEVCGKDDVEVNGRIMQAIEQTVDYTVFRLDDFSVPV